MIDAAHLAETFGSNHWLAGRLLAGLTHQESLLQAEFGINTLNWILGHIVDGRHRALGTLGQPGIWDVAQRALYKSGAPPVTPDTALPLESLVAALDATQSLLVEALEEADDALLAEIVPTPFGERPRWQHLSGLAWHETFHVGQLDLLRQLALDRRHAASQATRSVANPGV